jgi:hypothetical protein
MPYLLDSNVFIEAKNKYYQFSLCPGFWDWMIRENANGKIFSHESVLNELGAFGDDLSQWAASRGQGFFMRSDQPTVTAFSTVADWVASQNFKPVAVRDFLNGADPILIACGLAHRYTVVSHEVHVPGQRSKVKIPAVCQALNVPCVTTFEMLAREKVVFDLR